MWLMALISEFKHLTQTNKKGFHSLNLQMICDATLRFLDVVAKWPESVHDSRMFRESALR
ncbi:hypothetical protein DPMN_012701 [Dreissena polymorpha]|uniref:DDE Tnp4 domain-containing protein n=1 Tax=Dreissena polymorpha TaxID=45954 RepID=A0A9D4S3L3_DREPO|nr:hypothetical protein DPMN_012701 [Dreissena polymorpha]